MLQKAVNAIKNGTDSFKELAIIYLSSAAVVAILFALFEHRNLWDAIWWTLTTAMSLGLADIYAVTAPGELLTIVWSHFMQLFLYPLFLYRVFKSNDKN